MKSVSLTAVSIFCAFSSLAQTNKDMEYLRLHRVYESSIPDWVGRFENDIKAFEHEDSAKGNSKYDVVFIGSSTFAHWKTMQQDFAPAEVINRGFGGSTIREVIYYSDRILYKYKPEIVVLYVANDVWGKPDDPSTENLLDYFKYFEQSLHRRMPNTILNIVSMRPSPVKRDLIEKQNLINDSLKDFSSKRENTNFIDIRPAMYTGEGKLRSDIFSSDSLHLNNTGNQLLVDVVKPIILSQLK